MSENLRNKLVARTGMVYRAEDDKYVEGWRSGLPLGTDLSKAAEEYVEKWNSRLTPDGNHNDASLAAIGCKCVRLVYVDRNSRENIQAALKRVYGGSGDFDANKEHAVTSPDLGGKWVIMKNPQWVWNEEHRVWVDNIQDATHFKTKPEAEIKFSGTAPYAAPMSLADHANLWERVIPVSTGCSDIGYPVANIDSNASLDLS